MQVSVGVRNDLILEINRILISADRNEPKLMFNNFATETCT